MSKLPVGLAPLRAGITLLALALAGLWAAPRTLAQANSVPPERMTYQGFLADGNGNPLGNTNTGPKNYDVIFRIWAEQNGGAAALWAEQQTVTVDKGYFSVLLGEGTAVAPEAHNNLSTLFTNSTASDRFVEMTVKGIGAGGANITIQPRLRLLTSPYAYLATLATRAVTASSVDGGALTTGTVPDARLSGNVALRAGGNNFTGNQTLLGGNFGIGTGAPADSLQLGDFGTGDRYLSIKSGGGNLYRTGIKFRHFNDTIGFNIEDYEGNPNGLNFIRYPAGAPVSAMYIDRFSGNVGIGGSTTPGIPLTFPNSLGDKLSLYGQSGNTFGFGIRGSLLQIHTDGSGSDIAFGYGSSASDFSMTERMRIKGNGNVGIGTTTPTAKLDVNGDLKVSGIIHSGGLPGHAPIILEEKTSNNQTTWNSKLVHVQTWANRPGGFRIRIYAQHETSFEVRNFDASVVVQQPGYANDPNASQFNRISVNWGAQGRTSLILGYVLFVGNTCNGYQESYPDGWVKISNVFLTAAGACAGGYDPGKEYMVITFHPAVSGQIVISDN